MSSSLSEIFEPNVYCDFHIPNHVGIIHTLLFHGAYFVTIHTQFANQEQTVYSVYTICYFSSILCLTCYFSSILCLMPHCVGIAHTCFSVAVRG